MKRAPLNNSLTTVLVAAALSFVALIAVGRLDGRSRPDPSVPSERSLHAGGTVPPSSPGAAGSPIKQRWP